jgi:hypothetical protein
MNTPITDAASLHTDAFDSPAKAREFARRLETDRAALMEALQEIYHEADMGSFAEQRSYLALSAARGNFPTP